MTPWPRKKAHTHPEKLEHFGLSTFEAAQFGAVPIVFNDDE